MKRHTLCKACGKLTFYEGQTEPERCEFCEERNRPIKIKLTENADVFNERMNSYSGSAVAQVLRP